MRTMIAAAMAAAMTCALGAPTAGAAVSTPTSGWFWGDPLPQGNQINELAFAGARGCDLLMVEATLPRPERSGERGHLTPREAGEHGRDAGAKRVVITHISDELDEQWARDEASKAFGSPVEVAREGAVYTL